MEDVVNNVRESFLDESVDEAVLQELKQVGTMTTATTDYYQQCHVDSPVDNSDCPAILGFFAQSFFSELRKFYCEYQNVSNFVQNEQRFKVEEHDKLQTAVN